MMLTMRALLLALAAVALLPAAERTWNGGSDANSNWTTSNNWGDAPAPNAIGDGATMAGSTRPTVDVDAAIVLGRLVFDTTTAFTLQQSGSGSLAFAVASGNAEIDVRRGSHVISCPVTFTSTTRLRIAPGAQLALTGAVTGLGNLQFIEGTPPSIISRHTRDLNGDGRLDAVDIVFNEAMSGAAGGTWTVGSYTVGTPAWQSTTVLRLPLTPVATPDTGALPAVRYTGGTVADANGNLLAVEGSGTAAADGAAPVLVQAEGAVGSNSLTLRFSEPVVSTAAGAGSLVAGDLSFAPANTVNAFSDANGLDQVVALTLTTAIAGGDQVGPAASEIFDIAGNAAAAAMITITAPVTARQTQQAGMWGDPATWVGGVVPGFGDDVVITHAVQVEPFDFRTIRSLTFGTGGSLAATAPPPNINQYTIIELTDRKVTVTDNATVSEVQFYDSGSGFDTVIDVSTGATLTLTNTVQGHFVRRVVKRGAGTLRWNSPPNQYFGGSYDDGPTRVEAGTLRLDISDGRPATYEWSVLGSATLDLRANQIIGLLTGQGTITRGAGGSTELTINGSTWSGGIENGSGTVSVVLNGTNAWSGINTFTGQLTVEAAAQLTVSGTRAIDDTCFVSLSGGATLTVDGAESIGRLNGSGAVVLNAALSVNHGAADDTFSGTISGSGALTVTGSGGSLALSGINTHAGGTTLGSGGTVRIASNAALGAPSGALTFAGGTLRLLGNVNMTGAALAFNSNGSGPVSALFPLATQGAPAADRPINVTAADGTIDMATFSLALPTFDTAPGQDLVVRGTAAATTYTGTDSALFLVAPPATTRTMAGRVLSGGGRFGFLIKRGAGTLAFTSNANTFDKNIVRVEEGALDFGASGSLGPVSANGWVYVLPGATGSINNIVYASAPILYLSGTLQVGGTSSWNGQVNLWSSTPVIDVGASAQLTLPGTVVSNGATALTKSGSGRLVLDNTGNTFALPVAVTGGTVQISADGCLGAAGNAITLAGGRLYATASFTSARGLTLGAGGGVVEVALGHTVTWNGVTTGAGGLVKDGQGGLTLGNAGNSYAGGSSVIGGQLSVAADGALGGVAALSLSGGGTLASIAGFTLAAGRGLTLGAGGGQIDTVAGTLVYNGAMAGTGQLTKLGTGILSLGGASGAYAGSIAVSAGTLRVTAASALGSTAQSTTVAEGSAIELIGVAIGESLSIAGTGPDGTGALAVSSGAASITGEVTLVRTVAPTVIAVANTGSLAIAGRVRGQGGLSKIGAGPLTLGNASNDFTGTVQVAAGTVSIAADGALGDAANQVQLDTGTLAVTSTVASSRTVRLGAGTSTIAVSASMALTLPGLDSAAGQNLVLDGTGELRLGGGAGTSTIAGQISGAGPLRKIGASTLVLTGASTGYTGTATVAGGTLAVPGLLAGTVIVASGGTLAGTGQVGDLTVQSGGVLSPAGASAAGVLAAASVILEQGAILDYDLGSANDQLVVSGAATVAAPIAIARRLDIRGFPNTGAFGIGDYPLISAGSVAYADDAITFGTVPAAATANYRVVADGSTLLLRRNRAPSVETGVADDLGTGSVDTTTTPPPYNVGPPGSIANFNVDVAGSHVIPLVRAIDPEGAAAATLVFTIRLDPSQGVIEWDASGAGAWQTVSTGGATSTWTQADVASGRVRYRSTGTVGGNDAILYDVRDAQGETSPLYLMRFTIQGNGPPAVSNTPATAVWNEESAKPGAWAPVAPAATVQDADTPILDGGLLQVTLLNPESGDEIAFVGNGVTVSGGAVAVSGVVVGTLVSTASDLTVTLNSNATEARTTVLLQSASFRTANRAPVAVQRSIRVQARDGTAGGGTTIVAFPLNIDLFNDAPDLALQVSLNASYVATRALPCVPGLARSGRVVASDPEGDSVVTLALTQSPLQGTLSFTPATGVFTYTPNFLPASATSDVLEDSFTVTVTDRDFSVSPSPTRVVGAGAASRYGAASRQVVVPIRIAAGASGLSFASVPRMTVGPPTGSFSYTPQMRLPAGSGTLAFELIDPPAGVALGSGSGEINFNPATGAISWPAVPAPPGPAPGYWRFGILATDPATGSATFLPIMLRVGSGGTNG